MPNLRRMRLGLRNLGLPGACQYVVQRVRKSREPSDAVLKLTSRYSRYPLAARAHASDFAVFNQIFILREYECLDDVVEPRLIVDLGANVGYSSAYFLSRFPGVSLVAVEPDPGNFEMLRRNLAPFGGPVRLHNTGIRSHPARLTFTEVPYRDGKEWGRQVCESDDDSVPGMIATDIPTLLAESGHDRISILKVDIEGAEGVVFGPGLGSWIDRVDNLVVELHDDTYFGRCSEIFDRAIQGRGFEVSHSGELIVCKRLP